jgi:FAD dependent oxidoreductase TIGR03364
VDAERVAIVGAGILGLAHAWSAAERGHRVTLFERNKNATGASIRNFGMIWPIGQPAGTCRQVAMESRRRWLALKDAAGVWVNACGSIHLAHRPDEWAVLEEYEQLANRLGVETELLSPAQVHARTPAVNPKGLRGGLFSSTELCVNPRRAVRQIPNWLRDTFGVRLRFGNQVQAVVPGDSNGSTRLLASSGLTESFDRVVVCGGTEFQTLFAEIFAASELKLCKLQMLKTVSQSADWKLGPHLASGLTLRHYRNFEICPSLPRLQERIAAETPELNQFGIHVMAAQNDAGEVILGDSHEYSGAIEPFDNQRIDELILRELRKIILLPEWTISERWHGHYAKYAAGPVFEREPIPNVYVCTGVGGAGMTLSFGLAEQSWRRWSSQS